MYTVRILEWKTAFLLNHIINNSQFECKRNVFSRGLVIYFHNMYINLITNALKPPTLSFCDTLLS